MHTHTTELTKGTGKMSYDLNRGIFNLWTILKIMTNIPYFLLIK